MAPYLPSTVCLTFDLARRGISGVAELDKGTAVLEPRHNLCDLDGHLLGYGSLDQVDWVHDA